MYLKLYEHTIFPPHSRDINWIFRDLHIYIFCYSLHIVFSTDGKASKDVLKIAYAYDLSNSKTYTFVWGFPYLLTFPKNTLFFFGVGWSAFSVAILITKDVLKIA